MNASITVTATTEGDGLLVSLQADGDFADEAISRRFYSITDMPPGGLTAAGFWAPILKSIGSFLAGPGELRAHPGRVDHLAGRHGRRPVGMGPRRVRHRVDGRRRRLVRRVDRVHRRLRVDRLAAAQGHRRPDPGPP